MKPQNPPRKSASRLATPVRLGAAAVAACFLAIPVLANPVNPTVLNGTASFSQAGNVLTVTNSNGAIINWDKFSIQAGETTRFIQSSASSSVLNRVLNDPSVIYGTLSSNGKVWLVNPAGIMVGPGGRIDTAGFVASTLNISNDNFLAGRKLFENTPGAGNVVNQGEIRTPSGGSVYLIAPNVSNEGIINSPNGEVILAAGQTVSLIDSATPGVKVDITGAEGNATNLGTITAEAGRIGIAGVIVRNSGNLNASSVVSEGGRIFLRARQSMALDASSDIRADGTKGGEVTAIVADENGIAGTLIARGQISAQGDGSKGSGGFVETSAAKVDLKGLRVKTHGGLFLIDPNDFTIDSEGDATGSDVGTWLASGDVTIQSSDGAASGNGDIFVNQAITTTGGSDGTTLTLAAERSIEVNAAITSTTYPLNINLQARATDGAVGNVGIYADITTNGGNLWVGGGSVLGGTGQAIGYDAESGDYWRRYGVTLDYGVTISTGGGNVAMYGRGVHNASGDADGVEILGTINAGGGNITLNGVGGNNPTGDTSGVYISGNVQTSGAGTIEITGQGGSNSSYWVANRGVRIDDAWITAENGWISIAGTGGGGSSSGNVGILIDPGSVIETIGSGNVSLVGVGGGGTGRNHGIYMDGGEEWGTRISSSSGSVSLRGTAGGHTNSEEIGSSAIHISGDSTLSAPFGYLQLESQGGNILISPYDEGGYNYNYDPNLDAYYSVTLTTHGDDIYWTAKGNLGSNNLNIDTRGIDASSAGAAGGKGGNVTLESLLGTVTANTIVVDGGEGGWANATHAGGKGGKGGDVSITASNGTITVDSISANGGSKWWNANSEGGDGGSISLVAQSLNYNTLSARGGDGGEGDANLSRIGGKGGKGGSIYLTATVGDIDLDLWRNVDARGGNGGWGGDSRSGHRATAGGDGGQGGEIVMVAQAGNITADGGEGWVNASGGRGGDGGIDYHGVYGGGNGGNGGDAGGISLSGSSITLWGDPIIGVSVLASGGDGGHGGNGYNTGYGDGGTASYIVRNADGVVLCSGESCNGTWVNGGPPDSTTQISLPTSGTGSGTTPGGQGGQGGHAGNRLDGDGNSVPNITLVATDSEGSGIQLQSGVWVESMGGNGGWGGFGRTLPGSATGWQYYQQTYNAGLPTERTDLRLATYSGTGIDGDQRADGGWSGQNGWIHMESQVGISQPVNNGDGSFKTGRLTFPYDVGNSWVGIAGNVSFLGENNVIESVSGRVNGDFTFDGRGNESNYSRLNDLGTWWDAPLAVSGNLLVHSTDNIGVINATVSGNALILSDGSIWTYNAFSASNIAISANWDIQVLGSLTATGEGGEVLVAAGNNLTVSGAITGSYVDLSAGSTYDGSSWSISGNGGNLTLNSGANITGDSGVWMQATVGDYSAGDITQLAGSQVNGYDIAVLADRDISLAGSLTANNEMVVAAGRDLTVAGAIESTSGWVDLRAGSTYDCPDGCAWNTTATGGDVSLLSGSAVRAWNKVWIQATGGTDRPGDITQAATSEITSYDNGVYIVADRDISLAGTISAPSEDGGYGEIIVAAGRDLTVSGTVDAYDYVDLEGGVSYSGGTWDTTGLGGNVLLTAASSVTSGGDLWIEGVGGSEREGNVQALGSLVAGSGAYVDIYAWGNLTVKSLTAPNAHVYLAAGYDDYLGEDNPAAKSLTLGRIDATGGWIDAYATGAIVDGNAFTETNLFANEVNLTSTLGGTSGQWAIDVDVEATNSIMASVSLGAVTGGIYVRNWALQPGTVSLTDAAGAESAVKYFQYNDYDMTLDVTNWFHAGSGDVDITAGRHFTFAPSTVGGSPANLRLESLTGNLSLAGSLSTSGNIGLFANSGVLDVGYSVSGNNITLSGSTVDIYNGGVFAGGDLVVGGGTVNIDAPLSAQDVIVSANTLNIGGTGGIEAANQRVTDLMVSTTGDINIDGGYIRSIQGDVQVWAGGDLKLSNGGNIWAGYTYGTPYPDVSIYVGGNLVLTNGAHIVAGNDIFLDLGGSTSKVEVKKGDGMGSPSYVLSDATSMDYSTTHITFLTRTAGGIVIDGDETGKSSVGNSGFFTGSLSSPAIDKASGLDVQYAAQANDSVIAQIINSINKALESASTEETPTDDNTPKTKKDKKDSDDDSGFGSEDGKKDEKPAQRKVAQCS